MSEQHNDFEQSRIKQFSSNYLDKSMDINGVRLLSTPQELISGDFHVVIRSEDSIYILVADGAGHGLSAVIPGLRFPSMFVELVNKGHSILTIASKLNDELCRYEHKGYFIAITLVQINELAGFIEVLNCGNPSVILVNNQGQLLQKFKSSSLACGIVENENYELLTERIRYTDSARLYVFTDGVQDTLIQSGRCKNSEDHELLYQRPSENCFDFICSDITKAQSNEKIDDITLIEILIPLSSGIVEKCTVNTKRKTISENEIDEVMANCRILCIEPKASTREKIQKILTKQVRNIDLCETVSEAIAAYSQYRPNLIIIDLLFLLKYQSDLSSILPDYQNDISLLVSCEPSNIIVAEQLFTLPITRYLRKPFSATEVSSIVKKCIAACAYQHKYESKSNVFLKSSLAMTITDANKRIIRVNDAFCKITGYKREEVLNSNPRLLSSNKHDATFFQQMWHSINTQGHWSGEIWNKRKNGELYLEWITINAITNEYGELTSFCSVFSDITERKAVDEAIKKLSYFDDLTELPNRRLFKTELQQKIKYSERKQQKLAVLFFDLDNFKEVNDTLGHDYGDEVLKETAVRLRQCIHDSSLLARLGGDEFTLCITSYDPSYIEEVTKKILSEIAKPFNIQDEIIYVSMSIGIAIYPDHAVELSSLLKRADQAMFYAKEQGRNCVHFFTNSMEKSALEKRSLINDLRLAVRNKEFELFYQPIIDLQTNEIIKAEALIRWHHPDKGLIPPDKFIPVAEEMGLISEIGDWVFEQAVRQSKQWRNNINEHFQISINKSPKQFGGESHKQWLDYLVIEDVPTEAITIEITEGVLMGSKDSISRQLLSFRDQGIKISLDDFGTGYSSLAYLRKFDIDYIKIDRQFVQQLETNNDDQALCKAIIVMAHSLNIKVIAEGVETEGQKHFLLGERCDYAQGYLFSKPVVANDFEKDYASFIK